MVVQQWRPRQQHQGGKFECIGSRCHISPQKSVQHDLELAWTSAEMKAEEALGTLQEAIQMVEEDSYGPRSLQSSLPKKKLVIKKLLDKLLSASGQMHDFQLQFTDLRESFKNIHEKLKATERAHMEVLQQMEALSSDMQATNKQTHEEKDSRLVQQIQTAKQLELHELPKDQATSVGITEDRSQLAAVRSENLKLKQDIQALTKEYEAKVCALDLAEKNNTCALQQVEKHKELKQTEENLQAAKAKQDELQKQLEFYRNTWLEEASAEIEDAVKGSLDKAQACEIELHRVRKQQETKMREFEHKLQRLTDSLNSLAAVKANLEQRVRSMEEERTSLLRQIEKEATEKHHVETESRVLVNTVEKTSRELMRLKEQYQNVLEEMKVKSEDLSIKQEKENHLLETLESVNSQLEVQRGINSALMKKKEEVEWACLEAQAEREKLKQQVRELVSQ